MPGTAGIQYSVLNTPLVYYFIRESRWRWPPRTVPAMAIRKQGPVDKRLQGELRILMKSGNKGTSAFVVRPPFQLGGDCPRAAGKSVKAELWLSGGPHGALSQLLTPPSRGQQGHLCEDILKGRSLVPSSFLGRAG